MSLKLRALGGLSCLMVTACQGLPLWKMFTPPTTPASDPSARAVLDFQAPEFDGTFLSGRALIGVSGGRIKLDKRLIENVSVTVESVSTCETKEDTPFFIADYFPPPPGEEELLVLEPGFWYGADLRFLLFDEKLLGQPSPSCIEVSLSLRSFEGQLLTRTSIRASREAAEPPSGESPAPSSETPAP